MNAYSHFAQVVRHSPEFLAHHLPTSTALTAHSLNCAPETALRLMVCYVPRSDEDWSILKEEFHFSDEQLTWIRNRLPCSTDSG